MTEKDDNYTFKVGDLIVLTDENLYQNDKDFENAPIEITKKYDNALVIELSNGMIITVMDKRYRLAKEKEIKIYKLKKCFKMRT